VEAANFAIQRYPYVRRYYQRKTAKTNKVVAIKTVAHKPSRACYYIIRDQEVFDPKKAFGYKNGCGRKPAEGLVLNHQV